MIILKRIVVIIIVLNILVINFGRVYTYELENFVISQVEDDFPNVIVHLSLYDSNGNIIKNINENNITLKALMGDNEAKIDKFESFSKSNKGVSYIILVDVSKSLGVGELEKVKCMVNNFINSININDKIMIIEFGEKVIKKNDFSSNKEDLSKIIKNLKFDDKKTCLNDAVKKAINISKINYSGVPQRKVVLVLSDGNNDYNGGTTNNELFNEIDENSIPIYSIGLFKGLLTDKKQKNLDYLRELSMKSKGLYYQLNDKSVKSTFENILENINESYILELSFNKYKPLSGYYNILVFISNESVKMFDSHKIFISRYDVIKSRIDKDNANKKDKDNITKANSIIKDSNYYYFLAGIIISFIILVIIVLIIIIILLLRFKTKTNYKDKKNEKIIKEIFEHINSNGIESEEMLRNSEEIVIVDDKKSCYKAIKTKIIIKNKIEETLLIYDFYVKDQLIIGSSEDIADIWINSDNMSKEHILIINKNDVLYIRGLDSKIGTYVNKELINKETKINNGDIFITGDFEIEVRNSEKNELSEV